MRLLSLQQNWISRRRCSTCGGMCFLDLRFGFFLIGSLAVLLVVVLGEDDWL